MSKQKLIIIAGSPCVGKTIREAILDNKSVQQIVDEMKAIIDNEENG